MWNIDISGVVITGVFLLFQAPLILGAIVWQKAFPHRNYFEFLTGAGIAFVFESILVVGLLGIAGLLTPGAVLCGNCAVAASLCLLFHKYPRRRIPAISFTWPETVMVGLLCAFFIFFCGSILTLPPCGTDSLFYHFYYPASWIQAEKIFRVAIAGQVTEYYSAYGELFYTAWMIPINHDFFAKALQLWCLFFTVCSLTALGIAYGFHRFAALLAAGTAAFAGIVLRNVQIGNTDIINGYFLLTGVVFLLLGVRRKGAWYFIFSGVIFGIAAATKYIGLMLATPLVPALLLFLFFARKNGRTGLWQTAVAAVAAASPFYLWNWYDTGNPFYPTKIIIGNLVIFNNNYVLDSAAGGLSGKTYDMFFSGDINALSHSSALIFFGAVLLCPLLALFCRRAFRGVRFTRLLWAFMSVLFLALLLLQLLIYPLCAQPRQIIPLLFLAAIMLLPIFNWLIAVGGRVMQIFLIPAILLPVIGGQFAVWHIPLLLLIAGCCVPAIWGIQRTSLRIRKICAAVLVIGAIAASAHYWTTCQSLYSFVYSHILRPEDGKCFQFIRDHQEPAAIAYCGGMFAYLFTGNGYTNRVEYIPVSERNSPHPHEFADFAAQRKAVSYELWLARLRERQVRFLVCEMEFNEGLHNKTQEVEWARAHPDIFKPIVSSEKLYFFELAPGCAPTAR